MQLARRDSGRLLISLVPLIDVMMILLVFFMVTSTYLNLHMIPFVQSSDKGSTARVASGKPGSTVMVRIGADGRTYIRGRVLEPSALAGEIGSRLRDNPLLMVVILPSPRATTQNLVTAMDTLTQAGATRIRLIRLEAQQ